MTVFSNQQDYEFWMGRWSTQLAPKFVEFADLSKEGEFLDLGSGTGALSIAIMSANQDAKVVGIDPSEFYVEYSRNHHADYRIRFEQGDALDIPFPDNSFDGTLSLLILQELPDAKKALNEMCRVTRPGGCLAANQWNFKDGMPIKSRFLVFVIPEIRRVVRSPPRIQQGVRIRRTAYG